MKPTAQKSSIKVAERMSVAPTMVNPSDTLVAAKALMEAEGFRHLPVVDAGRLVGIITAGDVCKHESALERTKVEAAMTPSPVVVGPEASVEEAARVLLSNRIRGLPVVDEGKVVGMITTTDLLRALLDVVRGTPRP
jgi:CBS domain-containing protein